MSGNLRAYTKALYGFDAVARRVPDDAWDQPSPCADWTAREVAGHVIWGTRRLASFAGRADPPDPRPEAEVAGDDPAAEWAAARDAALESLDHEGALQIEAATPFGEMSVDRFLGIYAIDPLTHAWDLGRASGVPVALDLGLCERYARQLEKAGDAVRVPGMFEPEVEVAADADPVTRFIAIAGRNPA